MTQDVLLALPDGARTAGFRLLPGAFALTDIGNDERLVARYRDRIRYCPPRKLWLVWDGRRWAWDHTGQVVQLAKLTARGIYAEAEACGDDKERAAIAKHARDSEKRARLDAMVALAQSEDGIPVMPHELDSDPRLFNCENGTIDLHTSELREHRQTDLITKVAGAAYLPGAKSELWERFLADATGGDVDLAAYLQRLAGYCLYGAVAEKAFWFFFGPPDGMKSTFIGALTSTLGDYATATDFNTWLVQTHVGGNRGDIVALLGSRLVVSVEVRKGAMFDSAMVKRVTGDDKFSVAAKYEREIEFRATFALLLAGNHAPIVGDDDDGMWSRVRRVPFTNSLPKDKQDPLMREKLDAPEVRSAILAWAVEGFRAWREEHGVGTCAAVERSNADYRRDMDRVAGFFDERCSFGPTEHEQNTRLRNAYADWCEDQGVKPLNAKDFIRRLEERGCQRGKSNGRRGWHGVRLLEDWEDRPAAEGHEGHEGHQDSETFPCTASRGDFRGSAVPPDPADPVNEVAYGPEDEWLAEQDEIEGFGGEE